MYFNVTEVINFYALKHFHKHYDMKSIAASVKYSDAPLISIEMIKLWGR